MTKLMQTNDTQTICFKNPFEAIEKQGVKVFFMERTPTKRIGSDKPVTEPLKAPECAEVLAAPDALDEGFCAEAQGMLMKARFQRDGKTVWMLHNGSREAADGRLTCPTCEVWDPMIGKIRAVAENGAICVPALQSVFVVL